jgi:hypothetical protein
MPHTTNIHDFQSFRGSELVESYLLLIAIELALKDRGAKAADNHDVPDLLASLSKFSNIANSRKVSGELNSFIAQLRTALSAIWCTGPDGSPQRVPSKSYPYLRYCRHYSEWAGDHETKASDILSLNATCKSLRDFLRKNNKIIGVDL